MRHVSTWNYDLRYLTESGCKGDLKNLHIYRLQTLCTPNILITQFKVVLSVHSIFKFNFFYNYVGNLEKYANCKL